MRAAALLLILCLLFGCGRGPEPSPAPASSAAERPLPEPLPEPPPQPPPDQPSYVEELALAVVRREGITQLQGEEAVRACYLWLLENVYFADPVGLDIWRYASDGEALIPYLENRALSPLLFQIGSCEDFAAALVLLLRGVGLEAEYVAGVTLSVKQEYVDHAWAVVRLEGVWYHLDPQLEQNVTRQQRLTWRYYLKSDASMEVDHKWGEGLIAFVPDISPEEEERIRAHYLVPACPRDAPLLPATALAALPRPDMAQVERQILRIKAESGKGELGEIPLNVEPPVLVERFHVTPPLQPRYANR